MNTRQQATGTSIEWDIEAYISAWKLSLTIFFNHFHLIRVFGKGGVGGGGGAGFDFVNSALKIYLRLPDFTIEDILDILALHRSYYMLIGDRGHLHRRAPR